MDEIDPQRGRARELAQSSLSTRDPLWWFEKLYRENLSKGTVIPWADRVPNPHLVSWIERVRPDMRNKRALKIGSGLGDDSEYLTSLGCEVTGFDISPTAVSECRKRFPDSSVSYVCQDLFVPRLEWTRHFDFILESYTLQVLPPDLRRKALPVIASFLAWEGILLVITRGRDELDGPGSMPWPVTRAELDILKEFGLSEQSFEDYVDSENPPVRRFRAVYRKTG